MHGSGAVSCSCSLLIRGPILPAVRQKLHLSPCADSRSRLSERKAMIDRDHDLPLTRQAAVLNISRGSLYYKPRPVSAADLALMRRMDELHLEFPFAGARMLQGLLAAEGSKVGRRHVRTLMRRMGMETVYRRPNISKPAPGPWRAAYLVAVMDWFSRRVLSWRVSITMEAAFCIEALEETLARHGNPQIFNTDQGSPGRAPDCDQHGRQGLVAR